CGTPTAPWRRPGRAPDSGQTFWTPGTCSTIEQEGMNRRDGKDPERAAPHEVSGHRGGGVYRLAPVRTAAGGGPPGGRGGRVHPLLPAGGEGKEPGGRPRAPALSLPPARPAPRPARRRAGGRGGRVSPGRHAGPGAELDRF